MKTSQKIVLVLLGMFFAIALFSCDPAKRISRIVKRHPELVKTDTVWKKDTIITEGAQKDSSFYFYQKDTIVLREGNMITKYYMNHDSTIYLQGTCLPDTVIKYYPVQVNSLQVAKALTWKERFKIFMFDNGWWICLLLWLVWTLFGKVIKTALKTYFPFLYFPFK